MLIRYKVIKESTRSSVIVDSEQYKLRYFKDTVVEASPNTLGIMVFRRRHQALDFAYNIQRRNGISTLVLRVEVFGRGKTPFYISRWVNAGIDLSVFYNRSYVDKKYTHEGRIYAVVHPIEGTLCYDTVRVID